MESLAITETGAPNKRTGLLVLCGVVLRVDAEVTTAAIEVSTVAIEDELPVLLRKQLDAGLTHGQALLVREDVGLIGLLLHCKNEVRAFGFFSFSAASRMECTPSDEIAPDVDPREAEALNTMEEWKRNLANPNLKERKKWVRQEISRLTIKLADAQLKREDPTVITWEESWLIHSTATKLQDLTHALEPLN